MSATDYVMIQFREIPSSEERDNLSLYGITLLDYLPEYSFFASAAMGQLAEAITLSNMRSIVKILPGDKIAPNSTGSLLINLTESDGLVNIRAVFFSDVSSYEALAILENHSQNISVPGMLNDWVMRGDNDTINSLANESRVRWIEISSREDEDANDGARATIGANRVQSFYNLRGRNVNVGIWESGNPDNTHPDLEGRINVIENKMIKDHATHVAGTVGGTGKNSSGTLRGMAPNVTFCAYSTAGDDNEAEDHEDAIKNKGINLSQNSWRSGNYTLRGRYTARSKKFDQVVRGVYDRKIPVIFIAGNENTQTTSGYNTVMPPGGTAKNAITVGAVNSDDYGMPWFSSWGPTNDGRVKPDIVAPGCQAGGDGGINSSTPDAFINVYPWADWDGSGDDFRPFYDVMCGTSMAAPVVSGAVALMMEYFQDMGNRRHGTLPLPSTYKALLIHTAHDVNETGPDYPTGYGLINVSKATYFLRRGGINAMIEEGTITTTRNTDSYWMYVSNYTEEFKVTLAWDDWEGTENAYKELVNDLDLVVIAPNGTIYRPWSLNRYTPSASATTGIDRKNNVEQVYVDDPCDGNWTINVTGHIIANPNNPQNYSLVHNNFFPEILMGDAPDDDGTFPSGENFWDGEVWIDSNLNGIEDIAPVPGQINHLHATVQEFGGDIARDVSVNFYYANPSTAITYPDDWEFIGNTTISSIPAYGSADAYVSWIPPESPEHQCTIVTVSNAENPITYEGDVRDDKNIGMKNFWTISIDETHSFEFEVGNNKGSSGDARLEMNSSGVPDGWQVYLSPEEFYSLSPGQTQTATLMVTPPEGTLGEASIDEGIADQNATIHVTEYLTYDGTEEITGGVSVTFVIAGNETTTTTTTSTTTTTVPVAVEANRDLPSAVETGGNLTASIEVSIVNESGKPDSLIIKEYIPDGWNFTSSSPGAEFDTGIGEIRWLLYGIEVYSRNLTYVTGSPENATGTAEFAGELRYIDADEMQINVSIGGDSSITIGYVADSDGNGVISDFELLGYIDLWVQKEVGDFDLLGAINEWANS